MAITYRVVSNSTVATCTMCVTIEQVLLSVISWLNLDCKLLYSLTLPMYQASLITDGTLYRAIVCTAMIKYTVFFLQWDEKHPVLKLTGQFAHHF